MAVMLNDTTEQIRRVIRRKGAQAGLLIALMAAVLAGCRAVPPAVSAPAPYLPVVNVRELGAAGDGKTNDTTAFQQAAKVLQEAGGGTLVIPPGTYVVGRQSHPDKSPRYWMEEPVVSLHDVDGLLIEGRGAVLRVAPGLRIGAFDKTTGERIDPKLPFVDYACQARPGNVIAIANSRHVTIRHLELDGNAGNLLLGGKWGDTGRQCMASGIWLYGNSVVRLEDIRAHDFGLDGVIIGYRGLKEADPPTPHLLVNVRCERNARQGLSWVGGRGVTAVDCVFNRTGRGPFASAPGAGLDIEAENSICRDGLFVNCEFADNVGCGVVSDSGDGGHTRFVNCRIWGTTSWSVWVTKPGVSFEDCAIHGSIVHGYGSPDPMLATRYLRCRFDDDELPGRGCYRATALIIGNGDNLTFEDCTITARHTKSFYLDNSNDHEVLRRCRVIHGWASPRLHDFLSLLRGCYLEDVHFMEELPATEQEPCTILPQNARIGPGVRVDGPHVKWANWSWGTTGEIEPTAAN